MARRLFSRLALFGLPKFLQSASFAETNAISVLSNQRNTQLKTNNFLHIPELAKAIHIDGFVFQTTPLSWKLV
jgi:hypothetical protein